jgi:hypothetical protein
VRQGEPKLTDRDENNLLVASQRLRNILERAAVESDRVQHELSIMQEFVRSKTQRTPVGGWHCCQDDLPIAAERFRGVLKRRPISSARSERRSTLWIHGGAFLVSSFAFGQLGTRDHVMGV